MQSFKNLCCIAFPLTCEMVTACIWNYNRLLSQKFVLFWIISLICIRLRDFALKMRKIQEIDFTAEKLLIDSTASALWRLIVGMSIFVCPTYRKIMKAAHDRQLPPRKITANLSLQLLQNLALRSSSKKFMKNLPHIYWTTQWVYQTGSTSIF